VLLVSAHPDDETIGAGRLVATCSLPVRAVTLTAGERCVEHPACPPDELAVRRLAEWTDAVGALGVEALSTPRWPDGTLRDVVEPVANLLADLADRDTVILATWRHDPHPDHMSAGRAAHAAAVMVGARLVEYPVWAPYWLVQEQVRETGFAITGVHTPPDARGRWGRAIDCYRTQFEPLRAGWPPIVPRALLDRHPVQLVAERVVAYA
jgi:LmbE family N-acetylglucosaminyl deacetylase